MTTWTEATVEHLALLHHQLAHIDSLGLDDELRASMRKRVERLIADIEAADIARAKQMDAEDAS